MHLTGGGHLSATDVPALAATAGLLDAPTQRYPELRFLWTRGA
ncbi:hypothetical protein ACWECC_27240 [Streptomyces microflavus]